MDIEDAVPGIPGAIIRRVDALPEHLPDSQDVGLRQQVKPGHVLVVLPGIGRFLARDGALIEFMVEAGADAGAIKLYLNGTARGALIHQRGELPLHAATLVPPGGDAALALCGVSGAGKSTLAAELSRRGWTLVADDTTRVTWDGSHAVAWPSRDTIKLWKDACAALDIDPAGLERVTRDIEKYYVHVPARNEPIRLTTIVELVTENASDTLSAGDKMALVTRNTYRPGQIRPLGMQKEHVRMVARIASACAMFRLAGGRAVPVRELADTIEKAVR